jgi:hypothetical protein
MTVPRLRSLGVLAALALAALLPTGSARAMPQQLDTLGLTYDPNPLLGTSQRIDFVYPPGYTGNAGIYLFFRIGPPPCARSQDCLDQFFAVTWHDPSGIDYPVTDLFLGQQVTMVFAAVENGKVALSDHAVVTASIGDALVPNPILFCTAVPDPDDYLKATSSFGNHRGAPRSAARGSDLYIRYPDGFLRNLTREAGYGKDGLQVGPSAIAVREPTVHWSGQKALFSMAVGGPAHGEETEYRYQLYEITGLKRGQQAAITKVPRQPSEYDNVGGAYGSDGRILFTSDRPRNGDAHLWPQLDEYEEAPTNTGIWSLDPVTGDLFQLNHAPSGAFRPIVDSFGRVVFSRWDHLERDQQKDIGLMGYGNYQAVNYASEAPGAPLTGRDDEIFPEARSTWHAFFNQNPGYTGPSNGYDPNESGHLFNNFLPWQVNQDGTGEETLNHIGRHELWFQFPEVFKDDPVLAAHYLPLSPVSNETYIKNLFHISESPTTPGLYVGVDGRLSGMHASGQIQAFFLAPGVNPDETILLDVTHPTTADPSATPSPDHSGFYRNPIVLSDNQILATHTADTGKEQNLGTDDSPISSYEYRLKVLDPSGYGGHWRAGETLTPGITRSLTWHNPYKTFRYTGVMWEVDPVEVIARPVPPMTTEEPLEAPEAQMLAQAGVGQSQLRAWLASRDLALVVSRNVTRREANDRAQPYNLRVAGTSTQAIASPGKVYDVAHMQFVQGDLIRSLIVGGGPYVTPGRRVLATAMHDAMTWNRPNPSGPEGSVRIANDGSMAALVPARRAMSWQMTAPDGKPVVRERYWVTFQPGEVRTCAGCHGINTTDQLGQPEPTNPPLALKDLLLHLKATGQL